MGKQNKELNLNKHNNMMQDNFFEKTLEELIFNNINKATERGLPFFYPNNIRQFRLPSGTIIDVISFEFSENHLNIKIFELKRDKITAESIFQVLGYENEIFTLCFPHFPDINIENILIGKDMDANVFLVNNGQFNLEVYLYKYTFDGVFFNQQAKYNDFEYEELCKKLNPGDKSFNFIDRLKGIQEANLKTKTN